MVCGTVMPRLEAEVIEVPLQTGVELVTVASVVAGSGEVMAARVFGTVTPVATQL